MRDPNRIQPVIDLLLEVWLLAPDLRLGQLIEAARQVACGTAPISVFVVEDDLLEAGLLALKTRWEMS